jgi:hypothetical protein
MKRVSAVALFVLCLVLLIMGEAREGDAWFNCHVSGNQVCGAGAPWHGFVGGE